METQTPTSAPVAGSGPTPGPGQPAGVASHAQGLAAKHGAKVFKSTPEQRAKWREKQRLRRNRALAQAGLPIPNDPPPRIPLSGPVADPPSPTPPPPAPGGAVPWNSEHLRPLFEQVLPAIEKADVESLKAKAAAVSEDLVPEVEKDAAWNMAAKATLMPAGPIATADLLNSAGLEATNAPYVAVTVALGSIVTGRIILANKLERMALAKEAKEKEANAN